MYEITIETNRTLVAVKGHPAVTIPLEPVPAEKFAPGYTRLAWIWSAVNNALERENMVIPDEDMKEITITIALAKSYITRDVTTENVNSICMRMCSTTEP